MLFIRAPQASGSIFGQVVVSLPSIMLIKHILVYLMLLNVSYVNPPLLVVIPAFQKKPGSLPS